MVFLVDTLNFRVANYDLKFLLKFLGLSELKIPGNVSEEDTTIQVQFITAELR